MKLGLWKDQHNNKNVKDKRLKIQIKIIRMKKYTAIDKI